jgi:hypothetical protein
MIKIRGKNIWEPSFFQQEMVILDARVPKGILIQVPGLRSNDQLSGLNAPKLS